MATFIHNIIFHELQPQLPKHQYTPSDFLLLSILTVAVCGLFSPPTLTLSIPALLYSLKVMDSCSGMALATREPYNVMQLATFKLGYHVTIYYMT